MNCKTLYRGAVSLRSFRSLSAECIDALCIVLYDYSKSFGLSKDDKLCLVLRSVDMPLFLYTLLTARYIDSIAIIRQYESSPFYPAKYRVRFNASKIFSAYVCD